ncbi:UvrD-helicase domain-containing protein [Massilia sp. ST3]|uniref:UvrD-helicase domain-containing protein n=1 Tax=Massilia sp. ST3 TaxID=2824903 RepID=UPI001B83885F|nr:ATP-dependent helicase [Massilia sp. ST3]MBQ5946302.1 ATP-dependent helicase [Massilia sp. ST3]
MKKFIPTPEQQAVLDYPSHMVVTACPGSGKTAVIAAKVRQILPSLPSYRGIIAISYTRKASAELKRRCEFDGVDTKKSFFGTIDAFSISEIIAPFFGHVCGKNPKKLEVKYFSSFTEGEKAAFDDVSIHALTTGHAESLKDRLTVLYENGVILMESVGVLAHYVLENSPACRRYLKSKYSAIFIDEYQDSGEPQHKLFVRFRDLGILSIAVGDVNQSIFAFAHRDPVYLKSLCLSNSGYQHLELTINHRCHPSIINYANRLLDQSCALQPAQSIQVFRRQITGTQVEVVAWINSILEQVKVHFGVVHNREIGILVRNSSTGVIVKSNLSFPSRLFNDNVLTQSTALCSTIFCALLSFRRDIRLTAQSIIDEFCLRSIKRSELVSLRKFVIACRKCNDEGLAAALIQAAEALVAEAVPAKSLEELTAVLAQPSEMQIFDAISDHEVQILTLHKAKGLEFKVVFHLDLYDWIIPRRVFIQGCYDEVFENEQECLNLHYVGITRAQAACVLLTSTQRYNFANQVKNARSSQFFDKPGLAGLYQ